MTTATRPSRGLNRRHPMKRNDLRPYVQAQIFNPDGSPRDLTGSAVIFHMGMPGQALKVNAAAVLVQAAQGIVEYRWTGTDTDTTGEWEAEFVVDGIDTYPKMGSLIISITDDLG